MIIRPHDSLACVAVEMIGGYATNYAYGNFPPHYPVPAIKTDWLATPIGKGYSDALIRHKFPNFIRWIEGK